MEKVNIFYLVPTLEVGGSEWIAYLLAKGLNKERYNPIVGYYFWSGNLEDLLRNKGIAVINIGPGKNKLSRRNRFRSVLKLIKFLKEMKIKIIHISQFDVDILGAIAAKLAGVPVVISHIHGESFLKNFQKYRWRYMAISKFFIDKYVVCSKTLAEKFISNCRVDGRKVIAIQNCVDEERFNFRYDNSENSLRNELGLGGDKIVIGCIANFASCKGHQYLIDAISKVIPAFPNLKVILVGRFTPFKEELVKQAKSLGLSNDIIFLDFQLNIAEILNLMDIFILASLEEGLANVILEAMYMAKPVIATKVGGIIETIVDGETGILVPPRDSESLAKAIILLLTDKSKAQDMGRRGKERCLKEFGSDIMINKFEKLYESLLTRKGLL